jgi:hypothetical protein
VYDDVRRITDEIRDYNINRFHVRVVSMDDPVAKAVEQINNRFPGRAPRFSGNSLGGVGVDEVYIYPQPGAKP